ncbi:MAG: imidazole glycerol phosphate synthase subunit HisH [Pseudomonadota bacterium]
MTVAIIDYGSGNLRSAAKAFERQAALLTPVSDIHVTDDPEAVRRADRVVLPGVGAFADCLSGLERIEGMRAALDEAVMQRGQPFLGICVGMQLMASEGLEHGHHRGFGWIPGSVVPLEPADPGLKIPHMGWNALEDCSGGHPVLARTPETVSHAYFVHSYHLVPDDPSQRLATVDYGGPVTAMVGRDNLIGTQFHPEKSQALGLALIGAFLAWRP